MEEDPVLRLRGGGKSRHKRDGNGISFKKICTKGVLPVILIGLACGMIAVGATNTEVYCVQEKLPTFLVVFGILIMSCVACRIIRVICRHKEEKSMRSCYLVIDRIFFFVEIALYITVAAWIFTGSAWTFKVHKPVFEPQTAEDFCPKVLYMFSFTMLILTYVCLGVGIIVGCFVGIKHFLT